MVICLSHRYSVRQADKKCKSNKQTSNITINRQHTVTLYIQQSAGVFCGMHASSDMGTTCGTICRLHANKTETKSGIPSLAAG
mmetsp:Transcript_60913/g.100803  ORF Transcript_60913/g.100803 Transcript_60913/m.100803 type:complete len:83 (-) Transcript_60913:614-862(-)